MTYNKKLEIAIRASVEAGKVLMENFNDQKKSITIKESLRDVSSKVDEMAENVIIDILKGYDDSISIFTEEQGKVNDKSNSKYWLIDALDGTVNYLNQIPFFCVSIAYIEDEEIQTSAIYAPYYNDLYFASRGVGSFKNHQKLTTKNSNFSDSLFAVAFSGKSHDPINRSEEFKIFGEINDSSRGCLRSGSAALNLALLSEGSFDGCWGKANKYWDIAAGLLIAELAGNVLKSKLVSKENKLYNYVVCKESIMDELSEKLSGLLELN